MNLKDRNTNLSTLTRNCNENFRRTLRKQGTMRIKPGHFNNVFINFYYQDELKKKGKDFEDGIVKRNERTKAILENYREIRDLKKKELEEESKKVIMEKEKEINDITTKMAEESKNEYTKVCINYLRLKKLLMNLKNLLKRK